MASAVQNKYGVIILGNSGVGKSFLANILLGQEKFTHSNQPEAVTTQTTWADTKIDDKYYRIFNIPGLIEADETRIEINKREIQKAFVERSVSIILYVFGQQNGRIRDEDVVALNALHDAYSLKAESLLIIINGVSKNRAVNYEGKAIAILKRALTVPFQIMVVLDHINENDEDEKQNLRSKLINLVMMRTPSHHSKNKELELHKKEVAEAKQKVKELMETFERREKQFKDEIDRLQKEQKELHLKLKKTVRELRRAESPERRTIIMVQPGMLPTQPQQVLLPAQPRQVLLPAQPQQVLLPAQPQQMLVQVRQPGPPQLLLPRAPFPPRNPQYNSNYGNPNPY